MSRELYPRIQPLDFEKVLVGDSRTRTDAWDNKSKHPVTVLDYVKKEGDAFSILQAVKPETVMAGKRTAPLTVAFAPKSKGAFKGKIKPVGTNHKGFALKARSLYLKGEGVHCVEKNVAVAHPDRITRRGEDPLDFGIIDIGSSRTESFQFYALGPKQIVLKRVKGPDDQVFSAPSQILIPKEDPPGAPPPAPYASVHMTFHPKGPKPKKYEDFVLYRDDSGKHVFGIVLRGASRKKGD